jgi:ABC-2 type transport system permease protein
MWRRIRLWWRKSKAVFSIYFQDSLAYRAQAVIWILTDVVPALVMPLVWLSAYNGRPAIGGYTPGEMVLYYLCMVTFTNFVVAHLMWDVAMEIKEGQFSVYLVRPFSYFQTTLIRNLAWRVFRLLVFVPMLALAVWIYAPHLTHTRFEWGPTFWLSLMMGHLVSFMLSYALGLLALFFQEVFSVYNIYYIPMLFLSGQLVPIGVFPEWLQALSRYMPFQYTVALPTEVFMGRVPDAVAWQGIGMQVAWTVSLYLLAKLFWRKGLLYYTGVGM